MSDDDGEIVMANRRIEEMFGYDRDVLLGGRVESVLHIRSRSVHRLHRARVRSLPANAERWEQVAELLGLHADGTEFPVEISLSAVAADRGPVTVAVIRDLRRQRARERGTAHDDRERRM